MKDYNVQLKSIRDLELFASYVKDAMCARVRNEKFSSIRLTGAPLRYNDFMHKTMRGQTQGDGAMEVSQKDSAVQLAGTIIHEMAHVLVGVQQEHNPHWVQAGKHLGLVEPKSWGQLYVPESFDPEAWAVVQEAIKRFAKDYPNMVYDPNIEIPWPAGIGTFACPQFDSITGNNCKEHKLHVLKFQIDGIRAMLPRPANLLADDMGLGKTLEVIGYINATKPKRILVGCPNNVKLVWKRHFEDFCTEPYDVEVAYTKLYMFSDVVIMNYEALAKWGDALKRQQWDLVVYDEGHYLKTPSAKRARAAYAIKGDNTIIITGTPIVNYPYEIFPLIHYLDRTNWPEYGVFEARFGSKGSDKLGRNLNQLNSILRATIMTRRLKKDVLTELPKKRRQIVEFEVTDEVRKLIDEEKKLFSQIHNDDAESIKMLNAMRNESDVAGDDFDWAAIIEELKYTKKFAFEEMAKIAHAIGLAKLPYVIEHIENAIETREKVIVFGHHRDVLQAIHKRFSGSVLLLGGNSDQALATAQAAERFNTDDNCTVFVGQMSIAQGYSIKGSSTVVFCEEDWVPGVMTQAEDRAHGIGRGDDDAKSMLIHHLVFEDSLDTYKAKLVIKKQKSIDRATGSGR